MVRREQTGREVVGGDRKLNAHHQFFRFKAEAAIVNYYHLDSTLSGHTDHSERDRNKPLLSIRYTVKPLMKDTSEEDKPPNKGQNAACP